VLENIHEAKLLQRITAFDGITCVFINNNCRTHRTRKLHLVFDIIKMSLSKLSDSDVELLTEQWRNGRSLWDVTFANYFNADERKAVLSRISQEIQMDGVATC